MNKRRQELIRRRLESAMFPLAADPRFEEFMELVRQLKEESVEFAVSHQSVTSERATLAALGEVRTYQVLLNVFEDQRQKLAGPEIGVDTQVES